MTYLLPVNSILLPETILLSQSRKRLIQDIKPSLHRPIAVVGVEMPHNLIRPELDALVEMAMLGILTVKRLRFSVAW
jgi:hypothetical protein